MSNDKQQVAITRIIDAPRELVWDAWTMAEHFANWFGIPPMTARPSSTEIEAVVGGKWRADMVSDDGAKTYPFRGFYSELTPPERLVLVMVDPDNAQNPDVETVTVTLKDLGNGKTEMTMQQAGHLPEEQYGAPLQTGYNAFFDRMNAYLKTV